jgi:hypothetical protein
MEIKMRKSLMTALGVLLIAGSAAQMTPASASARHVRHAPATSSERFRNAYDYSNNGAASAWCSREPGNPYNPDTDYQAWSAWRALGAWDSRNDCQ